MVHHHREALKTMLQLECNSSNKCSFLTDQRLLFDGNCSFNLYYDVLISDNFLINVFKIRLRCNLKCF